MGFGWSFIIIIIIIFVGNWLYNKFKNKISFRDGFALTSLPIVVLEQEGVYMSFLLDSGANISYLQKDSLKLFESYQTLDQTQWNGTDGNIIQSDRILTFINYKDEELEVELVVDEIPGLEQVKLETGVKIDGVLGSDFLNKYEFIINYRDQTLSK